MVCFPHMMARLYAYGVAVVGELTPVSVSSKLDCIQSCFNNRTCSSFFFSQQTSSCYLQNRWISRLVTIGEPDYFVVYPDTCSFLGYKYIRSVGLCLLFTSQKQSWANAQLQCDMENAKLVRIDNEDKNAIIKAILVSDYSKAVFYIGAHDPNNDQNWKWTDGSLVDYFDWAGDEPVSTVLRSCIQITRDGWDYKPCNETRRYICEKL